MARGCMHRTLDKLGLVKTEVSEKMLGCTYDELMIHLNTNARGFVFGDDTFGKLHVDHIRPISSFDVLCYVELLKACNYNNLQLLPASENLAKGAKFTLEDA